MRRFSLPLLVGGLCLLAPLGAVAQDYTPNIRPATFEPIDPSAPGVVTHTLVSNSVDGVVTPFPIFFYGDIFNQLNISQYGYVTFSSRPGYDELNSGHADAGRSANQVPLPNATLPNGLIAAWWDNLECPYGTIKTRDAVIQGTRTFTVEWNGCYISNDANTVQMQIQFTENSPIIRVAYGSIGGGTHTATVGIENPARWRLNSSTGGWTLVTPGGTAGVMPVLTPACTGSCAAASFPAHKVIQYGRPNAPDLQLGTDSATGAVGLEIVGLSGYGTITFDIRNTIENGGLTAANGATWEYYVSVDDVLDDSDLPLGCAHPTPESIPGASVASFSDTCTATLEPGYYRLCVYLDPVSAAQPDGAVIEASEANNDYCSEPFAVGADLVGSLTMPASAESGGSMQVPVRVENRGSDPTAEFGIQIWLRDCNALNSKDDVLSYEGSFSLEGGGVWEQTVEVPIRPDTQGNSYCALLVVDAADAVPELNETNNGYSSCAWQGDLPKQCAVISRPDLRINQIGAEHPYGCFFGDPATLSAEVCNDGPVEARSFGLAFFLDVNSVATLNDTMILSMPQACSTSAECVDLGGGAPTCVEGICHAPCVADADCGEGGLQCEPSFAIPGKSCQMVVPGNSCKVVQTTANLPTFDTRMNTEFADGNMFFSVIADWTDEVAEITEGNENKKAMQDKTFCWTRKPDFAPVEVRTLPELASGEVVPVFRRVHNQGAVGGVYGYRYVLSANDTISVNDLALSIEGVGPMGDAIIEARSDSIGTDYVRLPAGMVPGEYYLGIILDPNDLVLELLEDNNTAMSAKVTVVDASLRIATPSLQSATVGVNYAVQLLAAGGEGAYSWSLAEGALPPGFRLEADGLLHGTPLEVGTYLFQAQVASGGNAAARLFALDVLEARGPLAITLAELPPAFQNVDYRVLLGATGGLPPYAWDCPGKPSWLTLQNGFLFGRSAVVATPVTFSCEVTDANGTRVAQEYRLGVYPANGIRIRSQEIAGGDIGRELNSCLAAEGGSGQYDWSFDSSSAPAGVQFAERDNAGCFSGIPATCGTFLVGVTVTDAVSGLSDTRRLSLTVYCNNLRLSTRTLPVAERGVAYEAQLQASSPIPVTFELARGTLPQGLELAADGRISGVVSVDAAPGVHQLAVRLSDSQGGSGLAAIAIEVLPDPVPPVTLTKTKTLSGCSAAGEESAAGLLPFAALFALLGLRRRISVRPAAAAGLAAAALLLPAVAFAQSTPGYATYHRPKPYEPLTDGKVLVPSANDTAFKITLNGWTVPFFGENYDWMWFHENGLVLFSNFNSTTTPYPIPYTTSTSPRNFIAGWWDDHTVSAGGSLFRYEVRGTAPNRELVFEWIWKTSTTSDLDDGGQHQVAIFEDGTIAIRWAEIIDSGKYTSSHRAVMGLMDAAASPRSVPFMACSVYNQSSSASCDSSVWTKNLTNTEAIFTTLPNLQVLSTSTLVEGLSGLDQTFTATVYNYGPFATSARVQFYVSPDDKFSDDDVLVGTTPEVQIGAFAERVVEFEKALPRELTVGRYYVLAVADPENAVKEFVEDDNAGGAFGFNVVEPLPDLSVLRLGAPASGAPGSTIGVDLSVQNLGNLAGQDVPYAVVLSENEVISASDQVLREGTITVDWLATVEESLAVTIPSGTLPGLYYVGVVIDPSGTVVELDKLNNAARAERPFVVSVDGLAILTVAPTSIQVGAEFCIPLVAEGGDGVYTWSLAAGKLPPGIDLLPGGQAGGAALCGRPTTVGLYDFSLEVVSGNLGATTEMTIEVERNTLALGISGRELPTARFQTAYEAGLTAFGGTPPYTWTQLDGLLPVGLSFQSDGVIFGTPLEAGTFTFKASVTDAANRTATETITLLVAPPSRVTCATRTLGTLALGESFEGKLLAAGGTGGYEWTTRSTRRIGDSGAVALDEAAPPPGLILGVTGEITGRPEQVGNYIWTVEVKIGADSDICPITVAVNGPQGLTVVTTQLPKAVPDREYRAQLQAINGVGTLTWTLADGAYLPEGLSLDATGVIYGKPTVAALQGASGRTYGFLVEVRDGRNVKGTESLAVTVAPEAEGTIEEVKVTKDEGCSAAGGGFSLAALGLVIAALRRRR